MFDLSKLCGRIIEKYGTRAAFAAAVGLQESALSNRLNNKVPIDAEEIILWSSSEMLDIPPEEIHVYFLTLKVR